VVPDGAALAEARRIADRIAVNGPADVQHILASVHATMDIADESEALAKELEHAL